MKSITRALEPSDNTAVAGALLSFKAVKRTQSLYVPLLGKIAGNPYQ